MASATGSAPPGPSGGVPGGSTADPLLDGQETQLLPAAIDFKAEHGAAVESAAAVKVIRGCRGDKGVDRSLLEWNVKNVTISPSLKYYIGSLLVTVIALLIWLCATQLPPYPNKRNMCLTLEFSIRRINAPVVLGQRPQPTHWWPWNQLTAAYATDRPSALRRHYRDPLGASGSLIRSRTDIVSNCSLYGWTVFRMGDAITGGYGLAPPLEMTSLDATQIGFDLYRDAFYALRGRSLPATVNDSEPVLPGLLSDDFLPGSFWPARWCGPDLLPPNGDPACVDFRVASKRFAFDSAAGSTFGRGPCNTTLEWTARRRLPFWPTVLAPIITVVVAALLSRTFTMHYNHRVDAGRGVVSVHGGHLLSGCLRDATDVVARDILDVRVVPARRQLPHLWVVSPHYALLRHYLGWGWTLEVVYLGEPDHAGEPTSEIRELDSFIRTREDAEEQRQAWLDLIAVCISRQALGGAADGGDAAGRPACLTDVYERLEKKKDRAKKHLRDKGIKTVEAVAGVGKEDRSRATDAVTRVRQQEAAAIEKAINERKWDGDAGVWREKFPWEIEDDIAKVKGALTVPVLKR